MGFLRKKEERAIDVFLSAFISDNEITKEKALNIPTMTACVEFISSTIASLPIKLYKEENGEVAEQLNDYRVRLLNDETSDLLNSFQMKKAMVKDMLTDKGGYAFIDKERNIISGLYYVSADQISIQENFDPIFKKADFLVNGATYRNYQFLKFLRNTKNGVYGTSVIKENAKLLSTIYNMMLYENSIALTGGNKKGFFKAEKKLEQAAMDYLKEAYAKLYKNNTENAIMLNSGIDFKEISSTSVELQLNETKITNAIEICKIFNIPPALFTDKCTDDILSTAVKMSCMPYIKLIETSLNKDILLENEKKSYYFAIDTKDLLKGDIEKRFRAYQIAVQSHIMQIDEVRYIEDLEPLGLDFVTLGLNDVLYYPKTKEIYTPNTNKKYSTEISTAGNGSEPSITDNVNPIDNANLSTDGTVAQISLNGAQIQSLLEIVKAVVANQLEYDAAVTLITSAFPFDTGTAKEIIGNPKMLDVNIDDLKV